MVLSREQQRAMFAKSKWNDATGNRRFDILTLGIKLKHNIATKKLFQSRFDELPRAIQLKIQKLPKKEIKELSGV